MGKLTIIHEISR